jgi:hypothetical protein
LLKFAKFVLPIKEDAIVEQAVFSANEEVFVTVHEGSKARIAIGMIINYVRVSVSVVRKQFAAVDALRW